MLLMTLRIDVTYPTLNVHAKEFPLDAACLFQACVNANAYRLDMARPALQALERATCVRIECAAMVRTTATVTGPRLPKLNEMIRFKLNDASSRLMVGQPVYRFANDGIHLSYFFDGEFTEDMLNYLEPWRLGHGESLCVAKASLIQSMPPKAVGMQSWEPSHRGRQMRIPRLGLLDDLVAYYNANKSSHEVEHRIARFSIEGISQRLLYRFYRDGQEHAFHEWELPAVAGMLRHAVIDQVPATLNGFAMKEYASNHASAQIQYLPLPNVGHEYADGKIRRAVIVDPLGMLPLHRVSELRMIDLKGRTFTAVRETRSDSVFDKYLVPSRRWVTVTPVLLNGYDTKHGKQNLKKRQKMLTKMFRVVGLPVPKTIQTFEPAQRIEVSKKHGKNYIKTMLAVEFENEVGGVVVVGAGQNSGMGIFANLLWSGADSRCS